MPIDIEPEKLRDGLMGLVIALVDIIKDVLKRQAFKRIEGGTLTEEECERLGRAFMDLDEAISELKKEHGVRQAVQEVRDGLDDLADRIIHFDDKLYEEEL